MSAAPHPAPVIELAALRCRFGGRTVLAVDNLALAAGECLAITGPNGSGKSTLLRMLAFLEAPSEGTVRLHGAPVASGAERRAARERVTLVEQQPFLFRGTVLENVAWGPRARGKSRAEAARLAHEALALLRSANLADRDARALSGGEAQRVAVARAVAAQPDALLLDEPASGADRASQFALDEAVAELRRGRPIAICIASHQLEAAYRWADRLLVLHEGVPSPVTPENLFRVELTGGTSMQTIAIGGMRIDIPTDRTGTATIAIPPEEIVLSREPLHSSARNSVSGRITALAEQGPAVRVTIDAGLPLVVLLTRRSFDELGLGVGQTVVASFKSVAVRVF